MNIQLNSNVALAIAIILEVAGTTALQMSQQLTKLLPALVMAPGSGTC
jgi:multidrug transporter EmrE-like cation transporter